MTTQVYQLPVNVSENGQIGKTDHQVTLLLNIAINGISAISNNKSIDVNTDVQYDTQRSNSDESSNTPSDDGCIKQSTSMALATEVMQVLKSYSINCNGPSAESRDVEAFLPTIAKFIEREEPVRMVLPAFPFKSPNSQDKVMGVLPDLGEELALQHLNALCQNIARVYKPGAEIHITSDGLVYNDILGVTDETVWEYGEALRQIAVEQDLRHLRFLRLDELLGHEELSSRSPQSAKEFYLSHASCLRRELMLRFGDPSFCARTAVKNDSDIRATYRGYIRFLTKDIAPQIDSMSKRIRGEHISQVARSMIVRGQMFAAAIKAQRGDSVRLSIHESTKSRKISVGLNPQDQHAIGHTPWHSCVVVGVNGSYRAAHVDQVRNTHDLVIKDGRPYCYRERSDLFDWSKEGLNVDFEHLYPSGLIIRPRNDSGEPPSIRRIAMSKLRELSCNLSPVVCRGFQNTEGEGLFIEKAAQLGKIATWNQDVIVKVKDSKRIDKENNNVKSNEAMPMHYDGMFKFREETDPITGGTTRVQNAPGYQVFFCRATASEDDDDGKTLFASSRLFFRYLPSPWTQQRLEKVTWSMENDGFWDAKVFKLPLLLTHPTSSQPCLRWHQPWDSTKTKFSTCEVTIDNDDASLISVIDNLTYDYRVCYRFKWEVGDLLVSDNLSMLHTRTGYSSNCDRELWRIHCD